MKVTMRKFSTFLIRQRAFLRGTYLEYFLVLLFFLAIAIYTTEFIILSLGSQIFAQGPGDASSGFIWLNYADKDISPFLDSTDIANYPVGEDLGSPIFITYLFLWLPIRFFSYFFGPIAGMNIVLLGGYVSTALSGYWLTKRLTGSIAISLLGGYSLTFFPYAIAKGVNHIAYIFNVFFILTLAAFIKLWIQPGFKMALLFGAIVATQFYFDGYFLLLTSTMVVALCLGGAAYLLLLKAKKSEYLLRLKYLFISFLFVVVSVVPILGVKLYYNDQISSTLDTSRSKIAIEIPYYKSWTIDFLLPAAENPYLADSDDYQTLQQYRNSRSDKLSNVSYLGFVNIILLATGVSLLITWVFFKKHSSLDLLGIRSRNNYLLVGSLTMVSTVIFMSFMLSPSINIFGKDIPLPGKLFIDYDINLWRNMSRFMGPLQVVTVIFSMYTLWVLYRLSAISKKQAGPRVLLLVVLLLSLVTFVEYTNKINSPPFDFNKQSQGYYWLRDQEDISVIAEFPISDPLDDLSSRYSTMQLVHGKKMVNAKDPRYRTQSNVLGSLENPESIDWAYQRGAQAIVTHGIECRNVEWGTLDFKNQSDGMCIYRINKPKTKDDLFAVIEKGAVATPNYDNSKKNTARLSDVIVGISITDEKFKKINQENNVNVRAKLFNWNHEQPIEGKYIISQNNQKIAEGHINKTTTKLDFTADAKYPIRLEIQRPNKMNDLLLQDIIVTDID